MRLRVIAQKLAFLAYWALDFLSLFGVRSNPRPDRIALVRLDAIGDFIIWLDAAKEYRRIYPNQRIVLVASAVWADFARAFPYWDEVWSVDVRRMARNVFYRWKLLKKIRQQGFSTAIQPTYSRSFIHGDSVIRATGAKERIGSAGDLSNISATAKRISDRWYTRLVPAAPSPLMELERNAEFVRNLTQQEYRASMPSISPEPDHLPSELPHDYFVLFPGASWVGRKWPAREFSQVAKALFEQHGWQLVLCGAASEATLCEAIIKLAKVPAISLAGQTSLTKLAEVIRHARMLVGNETSAIHLAAAVGTPAVCILGGGHYGRFMPYPEKLPGIKPLVAYHDMPCYKCNWRCTQPHVEGGPVPCIDRVSVELVLILTRIALAKKNRRTTSDHEISFYQEP